MTYRKSILGMAAGALAACLALPALAADGPGRGTSIDDWKGYTVLKGGKGAMCRRRSASLHYRDVGTRDMMPLVLLHQSPMSMIQWADVQNELAAAARHHRRHTGQRPVRHPGPPADHRGDR